MTGDEAGRTLGYDAWGMLVSVSDASDNVLVAYGYDALNRRIVVTTDPGEVSQTVQIRYYSADWQVLEDVDAGDSSVDARYVWSAVYVDAMVLRDADLDDNGTLESRLYVLSDANFNVTALVDESGVVVERFIYDPYGRFEVLNADWTADTGGSDYAWVHLHQGGRFDAAVGLYHFRFRDYSPTLMRWTRQDPHPDGPYVDGMNAYWYVSSNPISKSDPTGLIPWAAIGIGIGVGGTLSGVGSAGITLYCFGTCTKCIDDYNKWLEDRAAILPPRQSEEFFAKYNTVQERTNACGEPCKWAMKRLAESVDYTRKPR